MEHLRPEGSELMVSIDPGLRHFGFALWRGVRLVDARLLYGEACTRIRGADAWNACRRALVARLIEFGVLPEHVDEFAYEAMQVYGRGTNANPADLFELEGVSGACSAAFVNAKCTGYPSRQWMKGRSEFANHNRIRDRLREDERQALINGLGLIPNGKHEHVIEAVGIGLYHLRRL